MDGTKQCSIDMVKHGVGGSPSEFFHLAIVCIYLRSRISYSEKNISSIKAAIITSTEAKQANRVAKYISAESETNQLR
jgi:hypothetical protein